MSVAGASVAFRVSLSRAFTTAAHLVTVDYATADGTGQWRARTTRRRSGTLTFAAGEHLKTVSVPVLDHIRNQIAHGTLVSQGIHVAVVIELFFVIQGYLVPRPPSVGACLLSPAPVSPPVGLAPHRLARGQSLERPLFHC